jgi:hypothetical protein
MGEFENLKMRELEEFGIWNLELGIRIKNDGAKGLLGSWLE